MIFINMLPKDKCWCAEYITTLFIGFLFAHSFNLINSHFFISDYELELYY